jgi:hypothetical protein
MLRNRCTGRALIALCLSLSAWQVQADSKSDSLAKRVYDATTHIASSRGMDITSRTVCDGKGHKRIESKTAAGTSIIIVDLPNKKSASIIESSKMVVWNPLDPATVGEPGNIKEKTKVKSLGAKTIGGHPCKGESFTVGANNYELWTGTDIDYPVKTTVTTDSGSTTTELKSFSTKTPDAGWFEVPSTGYRVVNAK